MKITMLGCGASSGVPLVGCGCGVCMSANPRNKRTRVSVYIETGDARLLIDTSPDLRQQCLSSQINRVDAILYTHEHADHTHGIDDVRPFNYAANGTLPAYADAATAEKLRLRFPYVFLPPRPQYGWFRPSLEMHEITPLQPFQVKRTEILPFAQVHGAIQSLGFRVGNFAYSTDVNELPEASFRALEGVEVWIVDCLKRAHAPTHADLKTALEWVARVKPKRAILTHMSHEFDYDQLAAELPPGVEPGYDGLVIDL